MCCAVRAPGDGRADLQLQRARLVGPQALDAQRTIAFIDLSPASSTVRVPLLIRSAQLRALAFRCASS
jgi:hypothetical protein